MLLCACEHLSESLCVCGSIICSADSDIERLISKILEVIETGGEAGLKTFILKITAEKEKNIV